MARVLVIDDDPGIRMIVRHVLEPMGHEVILGDDGFRGLGMAQHQRPDVVVLDLMMPLVDGFETLRMLATDDRTARIPVIVLSAIASGQEDRCREAGAVAVLSKPFEPEDLDRAIRDALAG